MTSGPQGVCADTVFRTHRILFLCVRQTFNRSYLSDTKNKNTTCTKNGVCAYIVATAFQNFMTNEYKLGVYNPIHCFVSVLPGPACTIHTVKKHATYISSGSSAAYKHAMIAFFPVVEYCALLLCCRTSPSIPPTRQTMPEISVLAVVLEIVCAGARRVARRGPDRDSSDAVDTCAWNSNRTQQFALFLLLLPHVPACFAHLVCVGIDRGGVKPI